MGGDGDTEMNEAQTPSLRASQANWEVCGEPFPDGHHQCCGHGRQKAGAEGTQVNLRPGRLALKADWHREPALTREPIMNPKKNQKQISGANMVAVEDVVALWILTCLGPIRHS